MGEDPERCCLIGFWACGVCPHVERIGRARLNPNSAPAERVGVPGVAGNCDRGVSGRGCIRHGSYSGESIREMSIRPVVDPGTADRAGRTLAGSLLRALLVHIKLDAVWLDFHTWAAGVFDSGRNWLPSESLQKSIQRAMELRLQHVLVLGCPQRRGRCCSKPIAVLRLSFSVGSLGALRSDLHV